MSVRRLFSALEIFPFVS